MSDTLTIKTLEGWRASGAASLSDYIKPGDIVDETMTDWAIEVMPPRTMRGDLVQIGEPANHVNGRATWTTFARAHIGMPWQYVGECYSGERTPPKPFCEEWSLITQALTLAVINAESRLKMLPVDAHSWKRQSLEVEVSTYQKAQDAARTLEKRLDLV